MKDLVIKARYDGAVKEKILKSFEPLLKKCCSLYVKNSSDFDDVMQEGRITILKCIKNYDVNSNVPFEAYVKRAVLNSIREYARKIKEHISLDEDLTEDGEDLYKIIPSEVDIENERIKREDIKRLYNAINNLSPKQREVILEHFFNGKSMVEIANNRRCHYMSVVRLKDRAIEKLKREFNKA